MMYLLASQWNWLVYTSLLGFAMGWIAVVQHGQGISRRNAQWAAGLVVALAALALARVIPGRPGYWLDLGLVMLAVYLIGCVAGSLLRDRVLASHAGRG